MNIVFVTDIDAGGIFAHYSNAINKYTPHLSNVIAGYDGYGYQSDLVMKKTGGARKINTKPYKRKLALSLLSQADIIVCNEGKKKIVVDSGKVKDIEWIDYVTTTRIFDFYGEVNTGPVSFGSPTISNQPVFSDKVDFFIPSALDTDTSDFKTSHSLVKTVRVSHSTHDRKNKNTESFLRVATYLFTDYDMDYDIIENCGYQECIARKKMSQIGVDHIHEDYQYYGISSLENSALGLVNFVNMGRDDLQKLKDFFEINFINWEIVSIEGDLYSRIKYYINNPEKLYLEQCKTEAWFSFCWDNKKIAQEFVRVLNE